MQDLREGLHLPPMSSKRADSPPRKKQAAKRRRRPTGKSSRNEDSVADKAPREDETKAVEPPPPAAKNEAPDPLTTDNEARAEPETASSRPGKGGGRSGREQARSVTSPRQEDPDQSDSRRRNHATVELDLLDSRAWEIYRNELQEVGGVLITDAEAREIATRSFTLARIFLVEKARQEAKEAAR